MPHLYKYKCNQCDFEFPNNTSSYMYVIDQEGNKAPAKLPVEAGNIAEMLGLPEEEVFGHILNDDENAPDPKKILEERTGTNYHCICLDCQHQFDLDVKKEKRICPTCQSENIKTQKEMVGEPCPKCKTGLIEKIDTLNLSP